LRSPAWARMRFRGLLEFSPRAENGIVFTPPWATAKACAVGALRVPDGIWWKGDRSRKLADLAAGKDSVIHPYFLVRALFGAAERDALFSPPDCQASQQSLDGMLQESITHSQSLDPVNRVSYLESCFYMRNTLLRDSDFMSMAHGVELRVPFLDRSLVEACFRIPGNEKLQGNSPRACCWRASASSCRETSSIARNAASLCRLSAGSAET